MIEAAYAEGQPDGSVHCRLCPHDCRIPPEGQGRCEVRCNMGGVLYASNYQECRSLRLLHAEAIPLFHMLLGRRVLAVTANGENLFCQGSSTAETAPTRWYTAQELTAMSFSLGGSAIAFVGAEPLMWFEFILETARQAHKESLPVILGTAGFVHSAPFAEILPFLSGVVLELYGIHDLPYEKRFGHPAPEVLETACAARRSCSLELVYRVVPGLNDSPKDLQFFISWVKDELGEVPVHLRSTRLGGEEALPPGASLAPLAVPVAALLEAHRTLSAALPFIYLDDVPSAQGRNTQCTCGALLVERNEFLSRRAFLDEEGFCQCCGRSAHILIEKPGERGQPASGSQP